MKRAMVSGNYYKSTGVYYGGKEPTIAHQILINITRDLIHPLVGESISSMGECTSQSSIETSESSVCAAAPRIWVVDVHTGLGPSGVDTLASQHQEELELLEEIFPTGIYTYISIY